eukprot:3118495-Amphidinium_carterae.1
MTATTARAPPHKLYTDVASIVWCARRGWGDDTQHTQHDVDSTWAMAYASRAWHALYTNWQKC